MNRTVWFSAAILAICNVGLCVASSGEIMPGKFHKVDTGIKSEPPRSIGVMVNNGDIIQLSVVSSTAKAELVQRIKVEIKGDAIENVGVVTMPVYIPVKGQPRGQVVIDETQQDMSCFLRTVKNGKAVVKITPIGADGKDRPTRELSIQVGPSKNNEKK